MPSDPVFQEDRFKRLVLHIAYRTKDDPYFGRTKLAKTLYYSDFAAYRHDLEAITGAQYARYEHGPFPPILKDVEDELIDDGLAREVRIENVPSYETRKLVPTDPPNVDDFSKFHLQLVEDFIGYLAPLTAKRASMESHDEPGWQLAGEDRAPIPYHTVFVSRRKPTRDDYARVEQLADELGWPKAAGA